MKISDLKVGDIIVRFTNFGGRSYTHIVTNVNFNYTFGHKSFSSGIYRAKGYEYSSNGVKYINEVKKNYILHPEHCRVTRNGNIIN